MAEPIISTEFSKWIPVVGTLLGAAIGFIGGFFNSWFINRNKEKIDKESRERARLENLYETLIAIRMDYQAMLGQMIAKVHFNNEVVFIEQVCIPPLVKLDMVINLYFPTLIELYTKFVLGKVKFGKLWANNLQTSFTTSSLQDKQNECSKYEKYFNEIDIEISKLQEKLASMARV